MVAFPLYGNYQSTVECIHLGENWIAMNEPIKWPPGSPDLSTLDFFYGVPQAAGLR